MLTVYLLSILDNLWFLQFLGVLGVIGMVLSVVIRVDDKESPWKPIRDLAIPLLIVGLIGMLTPTRRSLIEAYLIVEGSKIVNSDNVDKAIDFAAKRMEKIEAKFLDPKPEAATR